MEVVGIASAALSVLALSLSLLALARIQSSDSETLLRSFTRARQEHADALSRFEELKASQDSLSRQFVELAEHCEGVLDSVERKRKQTTTAAARLEAREAGQAPPAAPPPPPEDPYRAAVRAARQRGLM